MKVIGYMSHGQIEILETLPLSGAAKINGRPTDRYCVPVVKLEDASREVNAINMSIEAQVARTALKQLWEMLGVEDQTGAVLALRGELPRKEWPVIPPMFSYSSVVKHRKGGYYEIIGTPARCRWEITGEPVYFYRALIDDTIWVRTQAVMEDGRFEKTGLSVAEANGLMRQAGWDAGKEERDANPPILPRLGLPQHHVWLRALGVRADPPVSPVRHPPELGRQPGYRGHLHRHQHRAQLPVAQDIQPLPDLEGMIMDTSPGTNHWECPHCGRQWLTEGKRTGFVKRGMFAHVAACGHRTPAERREINRVDQARYVRRPPISTILICLDHPGLVDKPPAAHPTHFRYTCRLCQSDTHTPINQEDPARTPIPSCPHCKRARQRDMAYRGVSHG